jgi:Tol biopolymer transport system component
MTELDRLDRDLTAWFAETAAPRVPDYVDDILRQAAPVRQRPRWTFPERWLPMSVITLGRQTRRTAPWRTVGVVAALVLLLVVAVVVYVGSQRRVPPPFGVAANGAIAYVQTEVGYENQTGYHEPYGDILAVDPSSGATRTLVGGPDLDGQPVYALDGTRLSFVRQVAGGFALYAMDLSGGSPRRLTSDPLPLIREAAWSPDGRSIAFTVPVDGRSDLWIARADGSGARKLEHGVSAVAPQWRPPTGDELLFVGSARPGLDALGGYHGLYGYEEASELGLYLIRPDGGAPRQITPPTGFKFDYGSTSWTPDGQRIVTQLQNSGGYLDILVLDADGRELDRIGAGVIGDAAGPIVSPDGDRLAYANISAADETWRVHVRPLGRNGPEVISSQTFCCGASTLRWSPDGKFVVVNQHYYPGTWLVDATSGVAAKANWIDPGYAAFQRLAE